MEVFFEHPPRWEEVKKAYEEVKAHGVDLSDVELFEGKAADEAARTTGALGAFSLPAGV